MTLDRTQQPPITSFGALHMPQPCIVQLPNGIELYIIDKGDQEVCRFDILFQGGRYAATVPAIADIAGPMIRKGIAGMDSDAIAEHFDFYGGWIQTGTTQHYSVLSLFSLNRNLHKILPVVTEMITRPTLPQKAFDVLQQQRIQQLNINRQKVSFLAAEKLNQLIYGSSHPYARVISAEDLQQITPDDIRAYHQRYYLNTSIRIILSGRITDEVMSLVNEHMGSLPNNTALLITPPPIAPEDTHTAIIDKPDSLQSGIRIGKPTIGCKHPDYPLLTMLNLVLGGYFGSRLMTNIREEKGYTYGISSHIVSMRQGAYFTIVTEAGTEYTRPLIDEVRNEIAQLCCSPIPDDELETARNYLQGRRARALDSPFSMSDYFVSSLIADTPFNHFNNEDQIIRNATAQDLLRVAQAHLSPDNLYYAIAGDKSKMGID